MAPHEDLEKSEFLAEPHSESLRVVCYGSSSSKTPEKYLDEARALGYILAKRGHVCVNGAGSFGCMAAMNAGAASGNGHIVGSSLEKLKRTDVHAQLFSDLLFRFWQVSFMKCLLSMDLTGV